MCRCWLMTGLIALALAGPAGAAVRSCQDIVAAAGEDRVSELAAKQKALAGWTSVASQFGPAFSLWRNAYERSLSCLVLPDGTHRCQAYARPCGISQVPGVPPLGTVPPAADSAKREQRT